MSFMAVQGRTLWVAVLVYSVGLIAMFACSTAYNFASREGQPLLRRLDHSGVFLLIASTYTPFTTQAMTGKWAVGMTILVWSLAAIGILGKLLLPGLSKLYWVGFYLALGWLIVVAFGPLSQGVSSTGLVLLVAGGVAYTVGTFFYANKGLQFRRAIWHAHVLTGAVLHYLAIFLSIILPEVDI